MRALVDKTSDITFSRAELAKRCRWKVRSCELKSVAVANGESIIIDGVVNGQLLVGDRSMLTTPSIIISSFFLDWTNTGRSSIDVPLDLFFGFAGCIRTSPQSVSSGATTQHSPGVLCEVFSIR